MIDIDLLVKGVEVAARVVNERGSASFISSVQTPQAGADVRRYGVERAALSYGLRQNMDPFLFTESLSAVVSPTKDDISLIIGKRRRRFRR